jgi:hypothetical protein
MSADYNNYLNEHVRNVRRGFHWLLDNLPEVFDGLQLSQISPGMEAHDLSKWDDEEYVPYDNYFYGNRTKQVKDEFDIAWLHHQHNNPHHWQYWLLMEDSGKVKALEMPKEYILEMICDWWSFSWKSDNLFEIFDWYKKNGPKMTLHPTTKKTVEEILDKLEAKLEEETDYDEE